MISEVYNSDSLAAMRLMPDNAFELAIVDPPYGIGLAGYSTSPKRMFGKIVKCKGSNFAIKKWDAVKPTESYFTELIRVSKNQIIWGGNYFTSCLFESKGWVYWKKNTNGKFADGELAWTSFNTPLKEFNFTWNGLLQEDMANKEVRIHPTQKPVALYAWLLQNYAKPGDRILDTHLGSGSSRIAAHILGFDFTGYELDKDYFEAQEKRFAIHTAQASLFTPEVIQTVSQVSLFGASEL
jgi:site-specific DNA-methyltransferase (adenine-specific)